MIYLDTLTDQSPLTWFQTGGTVGILTFCILAFLRGWIITTGAHSDTIAAKDQQITELKMENAELKSEIKETRLFVRDQMTPLLTRTQDVLARELEEQAWRRRNPS